MMKISKSERIFRVINCIFMIALMFITIYPLYYVAVASVSNSAELMSHTGFLYKPQGFDFGAYKIVLRNKNIISGFINTTILMVSRVSLAMVLTILGAYVVSRKNAMLAPIFMVIIVITMFFNGGMIPTYLNVRSLGLEDTMGALVLPSAINAFNLIILRNAFAAVPDELEEAAAIDGAGRIRMLCMIMLPLVIPTLMVVLLYYAVEVWNSWFEAMLYVRKKSLYPLQLVLREVLINNNATGMGSGGSGDSETMSETVQYAVMMVATLPILLVYPFLQRYFVNGMMIGAVKG